MREFIKIRQALFVTTLLIGVLFSAHTYAYSGGTGTPEDPYQIATVDDWQDLMGYPWDWDKYFILKSDIDLQGVAMTPVGGSFYRFSSTFDGNGHVIRNLSYTTTGDNTIGLFGFMSGTIKNLGLENVNISSVQHTGSLVGYNDSGSIINCYSTGSVSGSENYIGGLVGINYLGSITDSYSDVSVNGDSYIGGLVGDNCGFITNCYSKGSVNGTGDYIGGLTGINFQAAVQSCYNAGIVNGQECTGGLTGINYESNAENCYNTGPVDGNSDVGGLVGYNNSTVTNCYSSGTVTGVSALGGLVGNDYNGTINNSFWDIETSGMLTSAVGIGKTTLEMHTLTTFTSAGWDFSITDGDAADWIMHGIDCPHLIWEKKWVVPDVVGMTQSDAQTTLTGIGLITETTEKTSNTVPAGHVIRHSPAAGEFVSWGATINLIVSCGRPYSGGLGTPEDPYQIADKDDLLELSADTDNYDKCFILTADIDLEGQIFPAAVIARDFDNSDYEFDGTSFTGTFNGDNYKITNLTISGMDNWYLGLFGRIESSGQVKNLVLENVNILGAFYMGGVAGKNMGTISYCRMTGAINKDYRYCDDAGGIIGWNEGFVDNCSADVLIGQSGGQGSNVGGLIGYNDAGTVSDCYATGSINSSNSTGGLIGDNYEGQVSNCSSASVVHGYWTAGGLIGYTFRGSINTCCATGDVTAYIDPAGYSGGNAGGLISVNSSGTVSNCYARGNVSASAGGGLIATNYGDVSNCYSTGYVTGKGGGFIGETNTNDSTVTGCFWNIETSGRTNGIGNIIGVTEYDTTGLTGDQMKMLSYFTAAGWDFDDTWAIYNEITYPYFQWQTPELIEGYSGGFGTQSQPYQIATAADWQILMATPYDWDRYFILTADIDLQGLALTPIGNSTLQFSGSFDGCGHEIRNITFNLPHVSYVGLFGIINANGKISHLRLESDSMIALGGIGSLAGSSSGTINDCYVMCNMNTVSEYGNIGGLIGSNSGTISNCAMEGTISVGADCGAVGGLAGGNSGTISHCHASGAIIGGVNSECFAGLIGVNSSGTVSDCYATGSVTVDSVSEYIAGLVGSNHSGTVSQCYADSNVIAGNGSDPIGGLIGQNYSGTVKNCYAVGTITCNNSILVGGLIRDNYGPVSNCYAAAVLSCGDYRWIGGLMGRGYNTEVIACFWDVEVSGQSASPTGKGLTTDQMKSIITYQNAGWTDNCWIINNGIDYPHLIWENTEGQPIQSAAVPLSGSGTKIDPYQIWTPAEFALLSWYSSILDKHICLMADLDMSGIQLYPIGDLAPFTGVFDGQGHVISNVTITMPACQYVGLFSYVNSDGRISNLGLESVNIAGSDYTGALIGRNEGTVSHCYVTGVITGNFNDIGGLIGNNWGPVSNCYSSCTVTCGSDSHSIGGLIGDNDSGTISNCHAASAITVGSGSGSVGGLIGSNSSAVRNCYANGSVTCDFVCYAMGGLVGNTFRGIIDQSYAVVAVNAGSDSVSIGGLVGICDNYEGLISNCYAAGSVAGGSNSRYVGGLVGHNDYSTISNCYSTGTVIGSSQTGGLTGYNSGSVSKCFWNIETSGWTTSNGGTGKTTAQMKTRSTFTDDGWDFTNETANGAKDSWRMCTNGVNYPRLAWEFDSRGDWMCPDGVNVEDVDILSTCWLQTVGAKSDINNDDTVNLSDFIMVAKQWLITDCGLCGGADITGDSNVDQADLTRMAEQWLLQENVGCRMTDLNSDGKIDLADYALFAAHWLEGI